MQFFFQYLHRCLISGKRRLSVCMDRKASLRLNRYRRTPNDRNFFCSRMFPKNALGNSHTAFKGDIWCAITISMQPSVTDASGANRKPPPSYGRFIKATKRVFQTSVFSRQAALPSTLSAGLFSDGQGQLLRNLVYPALFYSAAFPL